MSCSISCSSYSASAATCAIHAFNSAACLEPGMGAGGGLGSSELEGEGFDWRGCARRCRSPSLRATASFKRARRRYSRYCAWLPVRALVVPFF
eukprot:6186559-Pleurochrysis_carterae.AAC.3